MPQQINNLELEVQRHRLKRQFLKMLEEDEAKDNPDTHNATTLNLEHVPKLTKALGVEHAYNHVRQDEVTSAPDTSLKLNDTEQPDLKIGIQKNGRKYSVRTNRKRFFFPNELNKFVDALETDNQRIDFDVLINTGARYNEAKNIKKEDIDFERGTLTIKVAKIKAKKGQKFPDPRTFKLSSQFLSRLKEYTKDLNNEDTLPFLTNSALNLAIKKIAKRIGIKDYYMISAHNLRKTHGQYLVALDVNIANICKRLGHDMNTFLNSYCSADIFSPKDREEIKIILGDLV